MRIGGEAPGGGAILSVGIRASSNHGFPPLGSSIRLRRKPARAPNSSVVTLVPVNPFQPAGRKTTPSSVWPVVTKRQSAMSSLRASATIIVLRVPARRSAAEFGVARQDAPVDRTGGGDDLAVAAQQRVAEFEVGPGARPDRGDRVERRAGRPFRDWPASGSAPRPRAARAAAFGGHSKRQQPIKTARLVVALDPR